MRKQIEKLEHAAADIGISVVYDDRLPEPLKSICIKGDPSAVIVVRAGMDGKETYYALIDALAQAKIGVINSLAFGPYVRTYQAAKAMALVVSQVMPLHRITKAILEDQIQLQDWAEYFGVTEEYLHYAIAYYTFVSPDSMKKLFACTQ